MAGRRGQLLHRISIHALREEGDRRRERRTTRSRDFYPRPPRGGRPAGGPGSFHGRQISIHALREEGDAAVNDLLQRHNISIHALREEGDPFRHRSERVKEDFYPRPPRGGRHQTTLTAEMYRKFLSTPSARRATRARPSRENRPEISIHALREEGDPFSAVRFWLQKVFLSTPSARRATPSWNAESCLSRIISIHALREEDDGQRVAGSCGAAQFLSTPSARRATFKPEQSSVLQGLFLSTPSARRATRSKCAAKPFQTNFYPRPPRGGRPHHHKTGGQKPYFYPRPPRGGRLLNEV